MESTLYISEYNSPIGTLVLAATESRLAVCAMKNIALQRGYIDKICAKLNLNIDLTTKCDILEMAEQWLDNYFAGREIEKRPPLLMSGSPFQNMVWNELLKIPYGTTISYKQLAERTGRDRAIRAVANTVGANPLWIFIPCHRIIGSNGQLTGYAGGLDAKRYLINHEIEVKQVLVLSGTRR